MGVGSLSPRLPGLWLHCFYEEKKEKKYTDNFILYPQNWFFTILLMGLANLSEVCFV